MMKMVEVRGLLPRGIGNLTTKGKKGVSFCLVAQLEFVDGELSAINFEHYEYACFALANGTLYMKSRPKNDHTNPNWPNDPPEEIAA